MLRPLGIFALAALSFLAAQGTGIRLFFHLFYLLLALLVLSYLWAWSNLRGLQVQRETYTQRTLLVYIGWRMFPREGSAR